MTNSQTTKPRPTVNLALIGIFTALWIALNLTVAPISFALTGLPIIHSAIIFFTLIIVVWATGQLGAVSFVAVIGSPIVLLANPSVLPVLGFVPAAIVFDLILLVSHHRINLKPANITIVVVASIACAYIAALVNGFFILKLPTAFTLTFWAGFVIAGGIIGIALALPLVGALERAHVKQVKAQ